MNDETGRGQQTFKHGAWLTKEDQQSKRKGGNEKKAKKRFKTFTDGESILMDLTEEEDANDRKVILQASSNCKCPKILNENERGVEIKRGKDGKHEGVTRNNSKKTKKKKQKERSIEINECSDKILFKANSSVESNQVQLQHDNTEIADVIDISDEEICVKNCIQVVPWEGYSPLHRITSGKLSGGLGKLLEQGIERARGKWKPEEKERLDKNMTEFLDNNEVKDFEGLILMKTKEDIKFRKNTQFLLKMCKGIWRTGADISTRITNQFSRFLRNGRYSKEENRELKRLYNIYGNKWKQIGLHMNRNHRMMNELYNNVNKDWKKGVWTHEEKKLLLLYVLEYTEKNEIIAWRTVSSKLKNRSSSQCRSFWRQHFSQITDRYAYETWLSKNVRGNEEDVCGKTLSNNEILRLVTFISDANIDDEFLVDWNDLVKHFDHVTSPVWLKWKFKAVCKEVPQSHRLEFTELIEQLIEIYEKRVSDDENGLQIVD